MRWASATVSTAASAATHPRRAVEIACRISNKWAGRIPAVGTTLKGVEHSVPASGSDFGEKEMKAFIRHSMELAAGLSANLRALRARGAEVRVALIILITVNAYCTLEL